MPTYYYDDETWDRILLLVILVFIIIIGLILLFCALLCCNSCDVVKQHDWQHTAVYVDPNLGSSGPDNPYSDLIAKSRASNGQPTTRLKDTVDL